MSAIHARPHTLRLLAAAALLVMSTAAMPTAAQIPPELPHCSEMEPATGACNAFMDGCDGGASTLYPVYCAAHEVPGLAGCEYSDLNDLYDCAPEPCVPSPANGFCVPPPDCEALPQDPRCGLDPCAEPSGPAVFLCGLEDCLMGHVGANATECLGPLPIPDCDEEQSGVNQTLCLILDPELPPECVPGTGFNLTQCVGPLPVPDCDEEQTGLNQTLCAILDPELPPECVPGTGFNLTQCVGPLPVPDCDEEQSGVNQTLCLILDPDIPPECLPGSFNLSECLGPSPVPDCDGPQSGINATVCGLLDPCGSPSGAAAVLCGLVGCATGDSANATDCLPIPGLPDCEEPQSGVNQTLCLILDPELPPECVPGTGFNLSECLGPSPVPDCSQEQTGLNGTLCLVLDPELPPECVPGTGFNLTGCVGPLPVPDCAEEQSGLNATLCTVLEPCPSSTEPLSTACELVECVQASLPFDAADCLAPGCDPLLPLVECLLDLVCDILPPVEPLLCPFPPCTDQASCEDALCEAGLNLTCETDPCQPAPTSTQCAPRGDGFAVHFHFEPGLLDTLAPIDGEQAIVQFDEDGFEVDVAAHQRGADGHWTEDTGVNAALVFYYLNTATQALDTAVIDVQRLDAWGEATFTVTADDVPQFGDGFEVVALALIEQRDDTVPTYRSSAYALGKNTLLALADPQDGTHNDLLFELADLMDGTGDGLHDIGTPIVLLGAPEPTCPLDTEGNFPVCLPGAVGDGFWTDITPARAQESPAATTVEFDPNGFYTFSLVAYDANDTMVGFTGWRAEFVELDSGDVVHSVGSLDATGTLPANDGDAALSFKVAQARLRDMANPNGASVLGLRFIAVTEDGERESGYFYASHTAPGPVADALDSQMTPLAFRAPRAP